MCRVAALLSLMLVACATGTSSSFSAGENLLTPDLTLDREVWEVLSKTEGKLKSLMWRRRSAPEFDAYVVTVIHDESMDPHDFRRLQDEPGRSTCEVFESIDLKRAEDESLPSLFWRTECSRDGQVVSQIAHLVVVGRDSLYHVQKIWRGPVAESERDLWIERLASIYVCDTRPGGRTCPEGWSSLGSAV